MLSAKIMYALRPLLSVACENPTALTDEQREHLGAAARRSLRFGWESLASNQWFVGFAIQAVCRTFESDPNQSAQLLEGMLVQPHLSERGYIELTWLSREIDRLIPIAPEFVEKVYRAAFTYDHESKATTSMGFSRIMPLSSTESQDYESSLYHLADIFGSFCAQAPVKATGALVAALQFYAAHSHASGFSPTVEVFSFRGRQSRFRTDLSGIWDSGQVYQHDNPVKMLHAFVTFVEGLAETDKQPTLGAILDVIADENELGVLWRRLLSLGARFPQTFGLQLRELCWAPPIMMNFDTTTELGQLLSALYPTLSPDERRRIESLIISIPELATSFQESFRIRLRNRLLGCLPESLLASSEARGIIDQLQKEDAIPPNTPLSGPIETSWGPYGAKEYLADEGVPVDEPSHQTLLALQEEVKPFTDKHRNTPPVEEDLVAVLPKLEALERGIQEAQQKVHKRLLDHAWAILAEACADVTRAKSLKPNDTIAILAARVLLQASSYDDPVYDSAAAEQFDRFPSWGPAARIEAAQGLTLFCRHPDFATQEVLDAVERLSGDAVPAVRFQVIHLLNAMYNTARELMWRILERVSHNETSNGVLAGAIGGPLGRLAGTHPDQVADLIIAVRLRIGNSENSKETRESCIAIIGGLYFWQNHQSCGAIMTQLTEDPARNYVELHRAIADTRGFLTHGPVDPVQEQEDAIRHRSIAFLQAALTSCRRRLDVLSSLNSGKAFEEWPDEAQGQGRSLAQLIDLIGMEIYFASGAFQGRARDARGTERELTENERLRFLSEATPILEELAQVGLPRVAHHLLQTLEVLVPTDPARVFHLIADVVRGARAGGYQYESLAVTLIVRLVERYLADQRFLFREDERCRRGLLEILDTFVEAGWPAARQLTYRLEEIWR